MKRRTIRFIPTSWFPSTVPVKPSLPSPKPASKYVPEWYAKSERWVGNNNMPVITNGSNNPGLKLCVPFLDGLTAGYILELHTDIEVKVISPTESELHWMSVPEPLSQRDARLGEKIPRPAGHLETHFAWVGQWGISVPKGYSVLLTHPFNRFDLPFTTLSGVMDSDASHPSGNIPFFLKANWSGVIEAGTPIAQVIPFKREAWNHEVVTDEKAIKETVQQSFDSRRVLQGYYKKNHWTRKVWE
jgi:hypothetical protein